MPSTMRPPPANSPGEKKPQPVSILSSAQGDGPQHRRRYVWGTSRRTGDQPRRGVGPKRDRTFWVGLLFFFSWYLEGCGAAPAPTGRTRTRPASECGETLADPARGIRGCHDISSSPPLRGDGEDQHRHREQGLCWSPSICTFFSRLQFYIPRHCQDRYLDK